jgi:hypothetical protein
LEAAHDIGRNSLNHSLQHYFISHPRQWSIRQTVDTSPHSVKKIAKCDNGRSANLCRHAEVGVLERFIVYTQSIFNLLLDSILTAITEEDSRLIQINSLTRPFTKCV